MPRRVRKRELVAAPDEALLDEVLKLELEALAEALLLAAARLWPPAAA